jgi:hypothetical protein
MLEDRSYRDAPVTIATLPANVMAAGAATTLTSPFAGVDI